MQNINDILASLRAFSAHGAMGAEPLPPHLAPPPTEEPIAAPPAHSPPLDQARQVQMLMNQVQRTHDALFGMMLAPQPAPDSEQLRDDFQDELEDEPLPPHLRVQSTPEADEPGPELSDEATELAAKLRAAQMGLFRFPVAAQAIFSALVAEGRVHAQTDLGQRRLAALRSSPDADHLREVWEATSLNLLEESESAGALPSAWVEAAVGASRSPQVEAIVSELRRGSSES